MLIFSDIFLCVDIVFRLLHLGYNYKVTLKIELILTKYYT